MFSSCFKTKKIKNNTKSNKKIHVIKRFENDTKSITVVSKQKDLYGNISESKIDNSYNRLKDIDNTNIEKKHTQNIDDNITKQIFDKIQLKRDNILKHILNNTLEFLIAIVYNSHLYFLINDTIYTLDKHNVYYLLDMLYTDDRVYDLKSDTNTDKDKIVYVNTGILLNNNTEPLGIDKTRCRYCIYRGGACSIYDLLAYIHNVFKNIYKLKTELIKETCCVFHKNLCKQHGIGKVDVFIR